MQRIRVILADDHPVVLLGVKQVLHDDARVDIVAEALSTDALFAALATTACDVLVTDYSMPGSRQPDGEAMLRRIRKQWPELRIVLLTLTANVAFLVRARDLGIHALVEKVAGIGELPRAVEAAYARRRYVSALLKQRLSGLHVARSGNRGVASLSASELRVARLFGEGLSVTDIAQKLHRAVATISRQKGSAMRKLGVTNHVELLDVIREHG